jgi:hypothetical protein
MAPTINLPKGVTIGPARELAQPNGLGSVEAGILFPLVLADGTGVTVWVPYSRIEDTAWIEDLIAKRVAAIQAING